ncbi:MAG: glycosyltransferase, partial [Deltaproteobacteria bacterium]
YETIVLDDASRDTSLAVIASHIAARKRDVTVVENEVNSGSPFVQWRKGVELARGDYVWIAEADDVADPSFLARLAHKMADSGAVMAFSDMWQIDSGDGRLGESYRDYLNQIERGAFDASFVMEGADFLSRFLSVKNVIMNVSGALFRREALLAALSTTRSEVETLNVAGDWRLYAEICAAGGKVVYDSHVLNGHRLHAKSVTHALKAERHLAEIAQVQNLIAGQITLSPQTLSLQRKHVNDAREHIMAHREVA